MHNHTGCPKKKYSRLKNRQISLVGRFANFFFWQVDQRPNYFPVIADFVAGLKLANCALFRDTWFWHILQKALMTARLISFCLQSFWFVHKCQKETFTIIAELKDIEKSLYNGSEKRLTILLKEYGSEWGYSMHYVILISYRKPKFYHLQIFLGHWQKGSKRKF